MQFLSIVIEFTYIFTYSFVIFSLGFPDNCKIPLDYVQKIKRFKDGSGNAKFDILILFEVMYPMGRRLTKCNY